MTFVPSVSVMVPWTGTVPTLGAVLTKILKYCWVLTMVPDVGFRNVIHGTSVVRTHGHPTAVNRKERLKKPPLGCNTAAAGGVDAGSRKVCAEANPEKTKRKPKKARVFLNRIG
jgi:hypothetical protein